MKTFTSNRPMDKYLKDKDSDSGDGKTMSGMTVQKTRLGSTLGAEANHSTEKAKVTPDNCS
jgi:hypothetical protein